MKAIDLSLLKNILTQPTAPFREEHVVTTICDILQSAGIPYFQDPIGNLIIGVTSRNDYLRLIKLNHSEPVRLFVAHMDHPGFHGVRWLADNQLKIKWHGGSPIKHTAGAKVWLATRQGTAGEGTLSSVEINKKRYGIDSATVNIKSINKKHPAKHLYGGFKFRAPVWQSGRRLYTKAADDLVGVYCVVATALDIFFRHHPGKSIPFLGLLTRAEEVGFIGALGHFDLGWHKQARRPILCVSLEASRTLPGAAIGKGPVVRLGDKRSIFDDSGLQMLSELAQKILPGKHQRRIMDGGTCEGTAATAFGIPTIALSIPLGNYHNQGFEGGQDCMNPAGPAPEFVHLDDIQGQLQLCQALMKQNLPWKDPWNTFREKLMKNYAQYKRLL